jgi:hypothetical protein
MTEGKDFTNEPDNPSYSKVPVAIPIDLYRRIQERGRKALRTTTAEVEYELRRYEEISGIKTWKSE